MHLRRTGFRLNLFSLALITLCACLASPLAGWAKDKDKDKDSGVHTTFVYSKGTDTWSWLIDNEDGGKLSSFAKVKLTRK